MDLRERVNRKLWRSYNSVRLAPLLRAAATGRLLRASGTDVSHLAFYEGDDAIGPLQREEALLLFGMVRTVRPKTVVEIGFHYGQSAFNFLRAMNHDAILFSFDIDRDSEFFADTRFGHDPRFRFARKSQDEIVEADIGVGRKIDFLFVDASHDLELNQRTFAAIEGLLAPRALVAIHDTGTYKRSSLTGPFAGLGDTYPGNWTSEDEYAHQLDERRFVNWIGETRPQYGQIHFHSHRTRRHGMTLLQAGGPLAT